MALYDVLRAFNVTTPDEIHKITKNIPDEAAISDDLQTMKDAGELPSIIVWALENRAKDLKPYCSIGEDGKLIGPMAQYFEYAIKLENTKKNTGKHAAGVIIANQPLKNLCPMTYDKNGKQLITGFDMGNIEKLGCVKYDILGVAALSKLHAITNLLKD
jgi:DNA polymerase-3 subunit alpha